MNTSSSEQATLKVLPTHDAVEVSVVDGRFGLVAHSIGKLERQLTPGIYELQLRIGPAEERRMIALESGQVHEERPQVADPNAPRDPDAVQLAVPSAAPVAGTSTTREDHMDAAHGASAALRNSGAASGIVVMVRNLRGSTLPFVAELADGISLVDAAGQPVPVERRAGEQWAIALAPLAPGGYALVVEPPRRATVGPTLQSVFAADGWQTLVFVANTEAGLAPERAAVHMTRIDDPWDPQSNRRDLDLAVEAARWSLRQGRPGISAELLDLLLQTKFRNPMLGILGAHVLLLDPEPDVAQLRVVVGNLSDLVPDHPDVQVLGGEFPDVAAGRPFGISWPPMLLASYTAALRRDAYRPGALVEDSPAAAVAPDLLVDGIWTRWRRPPASDGRRGVDAAAELDPAVERVLDYVDAVATRRGQSRDEVLARLDVQQCAIGAGLPTSVVRGVLDRLRGVEA